MGKQSLVKEALKEAIEEGMKGSSTPAETAREWPVEIRLITPVEVDGQRYEKLVFRSPRGRDWVRAEQATGTKLERMHAVLASLAEVPEQVFLEMDHRDHLKCLEIARDFFSAYELALLDPVSLLS